MCRETKKISFNKSLSKMELISNPSAHPLAVCKMDEDASASSSLMPVSFLSNFIQRFFFSSSSSSCVQREHFLWISSLNLARSLPWLWTCPIALSKALALGEGKVLLCVVSCGCGIWFCSCAMAERVVQSTGWTVEEKEEKEIDSKPCLLNLYFVCWKCWLLFSQQIEME